MWNFMQSNKSCIFSIKSRLELRTLGNFVKFGYSYKKTCIKLQFSESFEYCMLRTLYIY